jgi:hypothetical protein
MICRKLGLEIDGEASQESLETPVIFLIFKRPELTEKVFGQIRAAKPRKLFVVADGPRNEKEKSLCEQARAVTEKVDWDCEVRRNYAESNLGCCFRVSSGISWAFEFVETAIILEDDCIPDPTFFSYCRELLNLYRDDTRIMAISGNNFQFGRQVNNYSYYFSRYNHCWGWATWQRAWKLFDVDMKLWPQIRDNGKLHNVLDTENEIRYWTKIYDMVSSNVINSWAYRWTFACWIQNGLTILPNQNLVSNVGFCERCDSYEREDQ